MFIKKILSETFIYGVENRRKIFNSLKYPALGIFITSLFIIRLDKSFTVYSSILLLFISYFHIIFTINCHRLFLKREVPIGLLETIKWKKRNTDFLITAISLGISIAIFGSISLIISVFILKSIPEINFIPNSKYTYTFLTYIILTPAGYFFSRASVILPAAAIEEDSSFSTAVDLSEKNGWNLFILVVLIPAVTGFIISYIGSEYLATNLLTSTLSILVPESVTPFETTVL